MKKERGRKLIEEGRLTIEDGRMPCRNFSISAAYFRNSSNILSINGI